MGEIISYWFYHGFKVILSGGKGDWRRFTTLPNILKQFNPDLIGYSVGISILYSSQFIGYFPNPGTFNNKGLAKG